MGIDWDALIVPDLMEVPVLVGRATRTFDGENVTERLGANLTQVDAAMHVYEGDPIMMFPASVDIRVGDIVRTPVLQP